MDDLTSKLADLRRQMSGVNLELLENLNRLFAISNAIGDVKDEMNVEHFDPEREHEMLTEVMEANRGPLPNNLVKKLFKQIFSATVEEMAASAKERLKVNRLPGGRDLVIDVKGIAIGGPVPVVMAGPCSVENADQIRSTAAALSKMGVRILRGGAFKPRTSPYSFQGLEEEALKMMREVADELSMAVITEVLDTRAVDLVARYADILQVGTRNMFNFSLLKELGRINKPVMIKRGFMATISEFIMAAEYVYLGGNEKVILCERGIRTFEPQTRNTLDISSVPILKKETPLPVIVDVSHALGRKDILTPIAMAVLAAGADGLMIECHNNPAIALSDADQQLDTTEMEKLLATLSAAHKLG